MKLSECTIGTLVVESKPVLSGERLDIGHIIGLTVNPNGETIPIVHFAHRKEPGGCHHGNIERYID